MSDTPLFRAMTWVLNELGPADQDEGFLGDLAEEHALRQSDAWYLKEVVTAILVGVWSDVTRQPWLIAVAVLTGWIVLAGPLALLAALVATAGVLLEPRLASGVIPAVLPWLGVWLLAAPTLSGLTVGHLFGRVRLAALLAMACTAFLAGLVLAGASLRAGSGGRESWLGAIVLVSYWNFIAIWIASAGMLGRRSKSDIGTAIADAAGERFDRVMNVLRPMRDL